MRTSDFASLFIYSTAYNELRKSFLYRAIARIKQGASAGLRKIFADIAWSGLNQYFNHRWNGRRIAEIVWNKMLGRSV